MILEKRADTALQNLRAALAAEGVVPEIEYGPMGHIVATWALKDWTFCASFEPNDTVAFMRIYHRTGKERFFEAPK